MRSIFFFITFKGWLRDFQVQKWVIEWFKSSNGGACELTDLILFGLSSLTFLLLLLPLPLSMRHQTKSSTTWTTTTTTMTATTSSSRKVGKAPLFRNRRGLRRLLSLCLHCIPHLTGCVCVFVYGIWVTDTRVFLSAQNKIEVRSN